MNIPLPTKSKTNKKYEHLWKLTHHRRPQAPKWFSIFIPKANISRIFVGFGRIPIFGFRVITENHIFTTGAATSENMFFCDHE